MSKTYPSPVKSRATAAAPSLLCQRRPGGLVSLAILAAAMLAGGCFGGRRGVELVRVSGKLTCAGGPMPAAGQVLFVPQPAGGQMPASRPLRPGSAGFGVDGEFQATSWTPADGLVPGTYAVVIDCWRVPPTMDGPPAESFVAPAYGAVGTTPLELVVPPASGPLRVSFDVARRPEKHP